VVFRKLKSLLNRRKAGAARILVVEDDASQARFLEATLAAEGYQVRVVREPTLFESEMYAFRPNLVLMDVLLPGGLNGYDLVKFLRQEEGFSTVPVVFLSTEGQRKAQVLGAEAGGDDYLVKPVQPEDLVATVRSRLMRFRSLQDLMDRDELTSLLAHVPFLQQARLCLSRFARRQVPYALVFLQLDQMEDHVRRHGAKVRDILLQGLARFLQSKVRQTDIMGLYGEGQVAIVLEQLTDRDAARLIRRLQEEFASLDHPVAPGRSIRTTFSAGVAMAAPQFKTLKDWIDAGSGALGLARQFGTGRTILAGQQIPEE
jgi:diguanylate cyclase (GGDEF)-like protein